MTKEEDSWPDPSRSSPASGPTCRSRKSAKKASACGYDGLEIACWGDHMDVRKAAADPAYVRDRKRILEKHGLKCWALGAHLAGQCVGDDYDPRLDGFAPAACNGKPEAMRKWAVEEMKAAARAAKAMGCNVVNGFMGSPIWKPGTPSRRPPRR